MKMNLLLSVTAAGLALSIPHAAAQTAPMFKPIPAPSAKVANASVLSTETVPVQVRIKGNGSVRIASVKVCTGSGEPAETKCNQAIAKGDQITFKAMPQPGMKFYGWVGNCSGSEETCTVVANGPLDVGAGFGGIPHKITVYYPGLTKQQAIFTVVGSPNTNFICDKKVYNLTGSQFTGVCHSGGFPQGKTILLRATRYVPIAGGQKISGAAWGGACAGTSAEVCSIKIDGDMVVTVQGAVPVP